MIFLQQETQTASYGQDVNTVEVLYKEHQNKHEEIMKMREDVERACKEAVIVDSCYCKLSICIKYNIMIMNILIYLVVSVQDFHELTTGFHFARYVSVTLNNIL